MNIMMYEYIKNIVHDFKGFKFLNNFIRRYECVQNYQGSPYDWNANSSWATRSHINGSVLYAFLTAMSGFIHPLFLLSYIVAFLCHSPLMELWFQYYKEKDKYVWNVVAQMFERGVGFAFLLPLPIGILIMGLFGYRIL